MGKRTAEMILGIIGGIFGIVAGLVVFFPYGYEYGWGFEYPYGLLGALAIIFSVIGIVGAAIVESKTKISGVLMIVAAVLGLISVFVFYVLPAILLGIAGILALLRKTETEMPTIVSAHPITSDRKYCAYCGSEMAHEGMFCINCGRKRP